MIIREIQYYMLIRKYKKNGRLFLYLNGIFYMLLHIPLLFLHTCMYADRYRQVQVDIDSDADTDISPHVYFHILCVISQILVSNFFLLQDTSSNVAQNSLLNIPWTSKKNMYYLLKSHLKKYSIKQTSQSKYAVQEIHVK